MDAPCAGAGCLGLAFDGGWRRKTTRCEAFVSRPSKCCARTVRQHRIPRACGLQNSPFPLPYMMAARKMLSARDARVGAGRGPPRPNPSARVGAQVPARLGESMAGSRGASAGRAQGRGSVRTQVRKRASACVRGKCAKLTGAVTKLVSVIQ